jgi:hypothetical protein
VREPGPKAPATHVRFAAMPQSRRAGRTWVSSRVGQSAAHTFPLRRKTPRAADADACWQIGLPVLTTRSRRGSWSIASGSIISASVSFGRPLIWTRRHSAHEPETSRLAGGRVHREWLVAQEAAQDHHALARLIRCPRAPRMRKPMP